MRETILTVIRRITDGKNAKHVVPSYATYAEISCLLHKELRDTLNAMVEDGTLLWYKTLNDNAFLIKEE